MFPCSRHSLKLGFVGLVYSGTCTTIRWGGMFTINIPVNGWLPSVYNAMCTTTISQGEFVSRVYALIFYVLVVFHSSQIDYIFLLRHSFSWCVFFNLRMVTWQTKGKGTKVNCSLFLVKYVTKFGATPFRKMEPRAFRLAFSLDLLNKPLLLLLLLLLLIPSYTGSGL